MSKSSAERDWCIYIVECADHTLYTGCTNNLEQRLAAHNQGQGAKYTRGRLPVRLVYQERQLTHSQALQREHQIKQLSHQEKTQLADA